MKQMKLALAAALALAATGNATAATDTTTFQVRITVTESCEFRTGGSDVNFPDKVRSSAGDVTATGALVVNCTTGTPYAIGLDQGTYGSSVTSRLMKHATGTATIPYSLYRDAAMTQNWGDAAGATQPGVGNGSDQTVQVYGRVLGSSNVNVPAGDYADTITATITY
ncbi:MAG TPA: spore coat U domain-containing protein [Pseudoxanthomonas sp.]|nr:spore coat U domain-containing protein [Pseudoxanthomonas sp.]